MIASIYPRRDWGVWSCVRHVRDFTVEFLFRPLSLYSVSKCLVGALLGTMRHSLTTTTLTRVGPQTSFSPA